MVFSKWSRPIFRMAQVKNPLSEDAYGNQSFFDWLKLVWGINVTDNLENRTVDYYNLVLDTKEYYDAGKRARWLFSQPDTLIAVTLGCIAIVANITSLIALSQVKTRISSYTRLIMSLSVADIILGLSIVLYTINKIINPSYYPGVGPEQARLRSRCTFLVIKAMNTAALTSTLLNLMGMALDHYVAILKPLHYPILLSNRRKHFMMAGFWLISLLLGFSDFLSGLNGYSNYRDLYNYCEYIWLTKYQDEYPLFVIAFLCLIVMMFFYIRIYIQVRKHHKNQSLYQVQQRNHQRLSSIQKNKKTLFTTLLILGLFMICWLPNCLFQIILLIRVYVDPEGVQSMTSTLAKVDQYLFDLLLLNSICDPIIYSIRLKEVRLGFIMMCRKCCCCCCRFKWYLFRRNSSVDDTVTSQLSLGRWSRQIRRTRLSSSSMSMHSSAFRSTSQKLNDLSPTTIFISEKKLSRVPSGHADMEEHEELGKLQMFS